MLETRAKTVQKLPAQSALEKSIAEAKCEGTAIQEQLSAFDAKLDKWRSASSTMMMSLETHEALVQEEKEGEEGKEEATEEAEEKARIRTCVIR